MGEMKHGVRVRIQRMVTRGGEVGGDDGEGKVCTYSTYSTKVAKYMVRAGCGVRSLWVVYRVVRACGGERSVCRWVG